MIDLIALVTGKLGQKEVLVKQPTLVGTYTVSDQVVTLSGRTYPVVRLEFNTDVKIVEREEDLIAMIEANDLATNTDQYERQARQARKAQKAAAAGTAVAAL